MQHLQEIHVEKIPNRKISLLTGASAPELFYVPNICKGIPE